MNLCQLNAPTFLEGFPAREGRGTSKFMGL